MTRVLVMIPHGEVYSHDCVRAYHHADIAMNSKRYYNMGDLFVYDSSLKLLQFDHLEVMKITDPSPQEIDRYNNEFDYCFLRGSNYIHPHMQWENAAAVLEKIRIPVVAFGIGAQAPGNSKPALSDSTVRVLKLLSDRSVTMGVRGTFTAEILNDLGIQNSRIVGCPTLFRACDPNLQISVPKPEDIKKMAYTLRREVSADYTDSVKLYNATQLAMIHEMNARFELTLMTQGEIEEKNIYYRQEPGMKECIRNLIAKGWLLGENDPLLSIYMEQMFYSESVAGYEEFVKTQDLVVGYRLHGNLIAIANGTPAIYCTYDSRTREFVETYKLPYYDINSGSPFSLEDYLQPTSFDRFNTSFPHFYSTMQNFLEENNMPHRMAGQAKLAQSTSSSLPDVLKNKTLEVA